MSLNPPSDFAQALSPPVLTVLCAEHGERIAILEARMQEVLGGSQPGRIGRLEESVKELWVAFRAAMSKLMWMLGIGAGVLGVLQLLAANGLLRFGPH